MHYSAFIFYFLFHNFADTKMRVMEIKKKIGLVLRDLRKAQEGKLTQLDIAEYAGVSLRYYNYLENGEKMPSVQTLIKISEAYKMKLSDLCKLIEEY